jgi:hypothetical protein
MSIALRHVSAASATERNLLALPLCICWLRLRLAIATHAPPPRVRKTNATHGRPVLRGCYRGLPQSASPWTFLAGSVAVLPRARSESRGSLARGGHSRRRVAVRAMGSAPSSSSPSPQTPPGQAQGVVPLISPIHS